jgi:O-antigen/teichoic acid export membrane protein
VPTDNHTAGSDMPAKRYRWRILVNVAAGYISKTADLVIALLLIPFMVGYLGDPDYGLWILVGSVVAYGSLLDFGIAAAVTKYVSEYRVLNKPDETRRLIASALWLYFFIGGAIVLACILIAPWFPVWFELDEKQHQTARWLVILVGTGIGLSIPFAASLAVLKGLQRFGITSFLGTTRYILFALGTIAVLLNGGGLLQIAVVQIVSMTLIQIPAVWWLYRLAPEYKFGFRGASIAGLKQLISFSWPLFFVSIGGRLQSRTDEIVIGARLPVGVITPYSLALRLARIPQMLAEQFIHLVLPIASELHAEDKSERLGLALIIGTRLTFAVFLSFGVLLAFLAAPILTLWVGSAYAEYANLVWILVTALLFDTAQWPAALVLQGMNRHRIFAFTSVATGIANVGLSIALIPHFGLMGVALGTLIPAAIEFSLVILPYAFHVVGINPGRFIRQTLFPALAPSVAMLAFMALISTGVETWSGVLLISAGVAGTCVYAVIYLLIPANSAERKLFFDVIGSLQKRIGARFAP